MTGYKRSVEIPPYQHRHHHYSIWKFISKQTTRHAMLFKVQTKGSKGSKGSISSSVGVVSPTSIVFAVYS